MNGARTVPRKVTSGRLARLQAITAALVSARAPGEVVEVVLTGMVPAVHASAGSAAVAVLLLRPP